MSGNWEAVLNPQNLSLLTIGSDPVIVGSRSPPNDSLWDRIRKHGFNVIVYDRIAFLPYYYGIEDNLNYLNSHPQQMHNYDRYQWE